jgi:hypothetical protein
MVSFQKPGLTENVYMYKAEGRTFNSTCLTKAKLTHKIQTHPRIRQNVTQVLGPQRLSCKKTIK